MHWNGKGVAWFNDKQVHDVLENSGVRKKIFKNVESQGTEWYETDLETVKKAISAVKQGRSSLNSAEVTKGMSPIVFRPEQRDAINKTKKRFKTGSMMLWNAKMCFGKTLSALQVVKEMGLVRTLILTHRPVVNQGWFDDYKKIFYDREDYSYGFKAGASHESLEKEYKKTGQKYIYFASIQDLRGSEAVGGKFVKNDSVFDAKWDLLIIDEAHEGTQTQLGKSVMDELTKFKPKILQLSGTPYNLMDEVKEDEVFTWDYIMEQRAKEEWDKNHYGDSNPYAELPKMNIYPYDLGRLLENKDFDDEDIAFNFKEFFRIKESGEFRHKKDVQNLLDLMTKEDQYCYYPFSNKKFRGIFKHTLWMLPGVKAAKALSSMLKEHPVFGLYDVVNVAGDGDEEEDRDEALKKVRNAIDGCSHGTITLSCGRLTTGVTVPEWMGVLMLSGSFNTSAASYMQTIFRVQTPYTKDGLVKENCYVFDFAPDRTLQELATVPKVQKKNTTKE